MKKKRLLLSVFAAFSACSLAFAFTGCGDETPPPSGDDPTQTTPGGDDPTKPNPGGDDPVNPNPGGDDPVTPTPTPVNLGVFARKWVNADKTLDLTARTLTGASDFEVTAITGEGAATEIACKTDSKDYVLKLNEDGKLEMHEKDAAPVDTFMPDAAIFAGAWSVGSWTYVSVSPALTADGGYNIYAYNAYNDSEEYDSDVAYTSFTFDEDNNYTISLLATAYSEWLEADYIRFGLTVDKDANFKVYDEYDMDFIATFPYAYTCADSYLTEEDDLFTFDKENKKVVYTGTEVAYMLTSGACGAGYTFTVGNASYTLARLPEGIKLLTAESSLALAVNDPSAIVGEWANGLGNIVIEISEDLSVTLTRHGTASEIELIPTYNEGAVKYTFATSSNTNTIKSVLSSDGQIVEVAIKIESKDAAINDYYVKTDVRELFYGTYTDNLNTLTVGEDQSITITPKADINGEEETYAGRFSYNEDLECVVLGYLEGGYATNASLAISADGVLWTIISVNNDDQTLYMNQSTWLNDEAVAVFRETFDMGLQSDSDIYTSGVNGTTVKFDFSGEVGKVVYNGETYLFMWDSDFSAVSSNIIPQMLFVRGADDNKAYSLRALDGYLALTAYDIDTYEDDEAVFLVSEAKFESHFGTSYVYRGQFFDEVITIDNDGKFWIHTTDLTDSDSAVVLQEYNYVLMNSDKLGFTFAFAANEEFQLHMFVYIKDLMYASLTDLEYTREDAAPFVGTYYAANGKYVELSANRKVTLGTYCEDASDIPAPPPPPPLPFALRATGDLVADLPSSFTVSGGVLTADVTLGGVAYTLTVDGTTATLVEKEDAASTTSFTKRAFDRFALVGNYEIDDDVIAVSLSAFAPNMPASLDVKLNGTSVAATLAFDTEGKQSLTFSYVVVFPDFVTYNYTLEYDGTTLTLTKDETTATVTGAGLADYSAFAFEGARTYTDEDGEEHTLACLPKTDGKTPLYILDDSESAASMYRIRVAKDGTLRMTVEASGYTIEITNDDGAVSVGVIRPDPVDPPPAPPTPPPPPAPSLP